MPLFRNWTFTHFVEARPCESDTEDFIHIFKSTLESSPEVRYAVFQLEKCPTTLREHIQGYVQFKKKLSMGRVKEIFGYEGIHLESARGTGEQNRVYCTKVESRKNGTEPVEVGTMSKGKGMRTDLQDFVNDAEAAEISEEDLISKHAAIVAKYPRFVLRAQRFFATKRAPSRTFTPRPGWQEELVELLAGEPDSRKVNWYCDLIGNAGKSYFAVNYCIANGGRYERPFIINGGKWADILYSYNKERTVIFDWPRDQAESFPYAVAEFFKNGYFLSTKYESTPVFFDPPHVVIFANFLPDLTKLSADRWLIKNI